MVVIKKVVYIVNIYICVFCIKRNGRIFESFFKYCIIVYNFIIVLLNVQECEGKCFTTTQSFGLTINIF
jgi:hypothetical protein